MTVSKLNECGLVKTKFTRPRTNSYVVSRQRLHKRLEIALSRKITLVIAPLGYGKTTSVFEWLDSNEIPSAWFSLDVNDNNPIIFWKYIYAALDKVLPGIKNESDYEMSSLELLEAHVQINTLINRLADIEEDFVLVIDDLHLIENQVIYNGLAYLIQYMPPQMHMMLLSRKEVEMDLLRDEFKSQILRIGIKDLHFRTEEISDFYTIREATLNKKDIHQIENYTSGWPAALVAIAMSMENEDEAQSVMTSISNCQHGIEEYLLDEVIESYSDEKKDFLYQVSILDCLCLDLCYTVTGNPNGVHIIQEMNARNEFIIAFDQDRCMYRFNTIFKEFLYKELSKSRPELLPELYEKAALWCEKEDLPLRAISYYIRGRKFEKATALAEDQLGMLIAKNQYDLGASLISQLPREFVDQSIRIAGFYSLYYAEQNLLDLAMTWNAKTFELTEKITDPDKLVSARTIAGITKAVLLIRMGKLDDFVKIFDKIDANPHVFKPLDMAFDFNRSDLYFFRCPIYKIACLAGEKPDEFRRINEIVKKIIPKNIAYPQLALGEYLYEKNRFEEALPHLLGAVEAAIATVSPGAYVPAIVNLARIKRAGKDVDGFLQVLDEGERRFAAIRQIPWNYLLIAFKMRLYIENGNFEPVKHWIETHKLGILNEINTSTEFEMLVFARALIAMGKLEDAELLLLRLQSFFSEKKRKHSMTEALCLLAIVFNRKSEFRRAVDSMESALSIGYKEGCFRSFVDEQEALAEVLKNTISTFRKRDDTSEELIDFAKSILTQIQLEARIVPTGQYGTHETSIKNLLTPKELEVLELLAAAHSNEEIGKKLHIGIRTVKTHTANIYSKLGVSNRSQCIKLVNELQIFEPNSEVVN